MRCYWVLYRRIIATSILNAVQRYANATIVFIPSQRLAKPTFPSHIVSLLATTQLNITSTSTEMYPLFIEPPQKPEKITLIAHPRPLIAQRRLIQHPINLLFDQHGHFSLSIPLGTWFCVEVSGVGVLIFVLEEGGEGVVVVDFHCFGCLVLFFVVDGLGEGVEAVPFCF